MADNTSNMQRLFQTAGSGQSQQGTGYTNLSSLLNANKQNLLGQKVAGDISSQITGVQSQLADQQRKFNEEATKGQVGSQEDVANRNAVIGRFSSPSTSGDTLSDKDTAAFEKYRSGQYTGPQNLGDTSALTNTASGLAQQTSAFSPSGTQELLRRSVGGDRYTQGQSRLDSLLLNRQALTPVSRQASGLGQDINRANLAAQGQAQLYGNQAKQFATDTQAQLQAGMTGIDTAVQAQLKAAQDAETQRLANVQAIQNFAANKVQRSGDLTPADIAAGNKKDANGNIIDQYGNAVYDTTANARGTVTGSGQADYLRDLLSKQGAQTGEVSQLFGQGNIAQADVERNKQINSLNDQIDQIQQHINDYEYGPNGRFDYYPKIMANLQAQKQALTTQANNAFIAKTGLAGQAIVGGKQEDFYKQLAAAVANSPTAQNLTQQGVASDVERQNYLALNKLLGQQDASSKYQNAGFDANGNPITDQTKYQAGSFLLNPDLIKKSLGY